MTNKLFLTEGVPEHLIGKESDTLMGQDLKEISENIPESSEIMVAVRMEGETRLFPISYAIYDSDGLIFYAGAAKEVLVH